jgi:hypothetical protein
MTDETFEGVEISGRLFPFVRITESMQPKIVKKITKLDWRALLWNRWYKKDRIKYIKDNPQATYKDLVKEGLVYISVYHAKREWKIIRSVAFEKDFLWKWLGIIPYELRCNVIDVRATRGIKKKFDNYLLEMTKDQDVQTNSSSNLPMESKEAKSGD